ncbi:MAG: hypothetical protein ACREOI_28720 [bacterium]
MKKFILVVDDHRIEISGSLWTGKERVICDSKVVSEKRSFFYVTPHVFQLEERGEVVTYEVDVLTGWLGLDIGYVVRRNGIAVAHRP